MTSSAEVAKHLEAHETVVENTPRSLLSFPYPKSSNSIRWLHVAAPEELIVLRAAAGHVGRSTDPLLSRRVGSYRLDHRYGCWRFEEYAWGKFIDRGVALLDGLRHSAMYRTDVKAYYPSVDIERLKSILEVSRCLGPAALLILKILRRWQVRDGLLGIPIGPEASAIIGNFFLHHVDRLLEANGFEHLRWMDDIFVFGPTITTCHASLAVIDEALSDLRLTRSIDKTLPFDNIAEARRNLKDQALTSLSNLLRLDEEVGIDALHRAYDLHLRGNAKAERYRFRWIVKALRHKNDSYGCLSLARNPLVMNVDPKVSGQYLANVGLKDTHVTDAIMDRLSQPTEDRFDALDLHLLKAMGRRRAGDSEAVLFKRTAMDSSRRWPIRAYGWAAYVKSTKNYDELMEAARQETIAQLRRAMIASLKGHSTRSFLHHARANFPESRYAVHWLQPE